MKAKEFINALDDDRIVAAIATAEARTSGEIRVYVSDRAVHDAFAAARKRFKKLGMEKTKERNGVLIYVAPRHRHFAVVGDNGIDAKCGEGFWTELIAPMTGYFKAGDFTAGLLAAIEKTGALLARHFPRRPDDVNELSNEITRD